MPWTHPETQLWWVCRCRSKCVSGTDNSLTSSWILFRVSSFLFDTSCVLFLSDTFSREVVTPICSPRSELAIALVASPSEGAFIDLIANLILKLLLLPTAIKKAFWILSSTVSTTWPIFLSIRPLKHFSKVFTITTFSLTAWPPSELPIVNSWSAVLSMTVAFSCLLFIALPIITTWSKSYNWMRSLLFHCLFLRVETTFVSINHLYLKNWKKMVNQQRNRKWQV